MGERFIGRWRRVSGTIVTLEGTLSQAAVGGMLQPTSLLVPCYGMSEGREDIGIEIVDVLEIGPRAGHGDKQVVHDVLCRGRMAAHPAGRLDQPRRKTVIQLSECGGAAGSEQLSKGVGHLVPPWDVLLYGTRDGEICSAPPKTDSDPSGFLAGSRGS